MLPAGSGGISNDVVHAREIHSVEQIECFKDSFEPVARVAEFKAFRDTEIEAHVVGPLTCIAAQQSRTIRVCLGVQVGVKAEQDVKRMSAPVGKDRRDRDACQSPAKTDAGSAANPARH